MSGMLKFDGKQVNALLKSLRGQNVKDARPNYGQLYEAEQAGRPWKKQKGLWLVADAGIYLMSNSEKPNANMTVVYARGCDPDKNPDWFDRKVNIMGGDDCVEFIPLDDIPEGEFKSLWVDVTHDSFRLEWIKK